MNKSDWRLMGQDMYMKNMHLNKILPTEYAGSLEIPELWHEHCEFCMEKIDMNYNKICFCSDDKYRFVCADCFNDFKDDFNWKL